MGSDRGYKDKAYHDTRRAREGGNGRKCQGSESLGRPEHSLAMHANSIALALTFMKHLWDMYSVLSGSRRPPDILALLAWSWRPD